MLKLTAVTKDGNTTNPELVNGNFDEVLKGMSGELSQLGNYSFVVVTKHKSNDRTDNS